MIVPNERKVVEHVMTGPRIRPDKKDDVAPDDSEILRVEPDTQALIRRLVSTYFHSSHEERQKHCDPVVYSGAMHALNTLLRSPEQSMFRAELQRSLKAELHLDPITLRAIIDQVESTLRSINRTAHKQAQPA